MKKISVFWTVLFSFLITQTNFSQESWTWQNPYPHSNTFNASIKVEANIIDSVLGKPSVAPVSYVKVVAADNSSILTEFNSAIEGMPTNSSIDFTTDLKFDWMQDKFGLLGYDVKSDGTYDPIILTKGKLDVSWKAIVPPGSFGYISGFDFCDQTIVTDGQDGGIEYSTDSGTKWKLDKIYLAGGEFRGIKLIRVDHAQAYGDNSSIVNGTFSSTTGQFTWKEANDNTIGGHSFMSGYYGGFTSTPGFYKQNNTRTSADSLIVIVGTGGIAVRSTDGGSTFDSLNTGITDDLYGVDFADLMHGIAVGYRGTIIYTTDGGDSWSLGATNSDLQLNSVSFKNIDSAYAFGDEGIVLLTTDGGATWGEVSSGERSYFESIYFTDQNTGYVAGEGRNGAQILKTTDGGDNWVINFEDYQSFTFNSIYFVGKDTGYAAGEFDGGIFKTTDAGNSWNKLSLQGYQELQKITFTDANTGYAAGGSVALRTTDAGMSWDTLNTNSFSPMHSLAFPSKNVGYICGDGIIKTTDGGDSWTPLSLQPGFQTIQSIFFINENKGFCVYGGTVAKTTDGGNTWDDSTFNSWDVFYSVYFIDSNTGFITGLNYFGASSPIYKTTDGGDTWTFLDNAPTNRTLKSIFFTDANTGYLAGYGGTILKTTNAGAIADVNSNKGINLPADVTLYQNYPNPFNPSTKIRYSIPRAMRVKLSIYDILGRLVTTLVNAEQKAGTHTVNFDASNLASGVYFYRIVTPGFILTKKMLLIK